MNMKNNTLIREFQKKGKYGNPKIYLVVKRSEGFLLVKKQPATFGFLIKKITHYYDNLEKLEKIIKKNYWKF
jgi:hypothetical protein